VGEGESNKFDLNPKKAENSCESHHHRDTHDPERTTCGEYLS